MPEGETYGRSRGGDVLACGKKQVARLISAKRRRRLGSALVGRDAEELVFNTTYVLDIRIIGIGIVGAFVPIQRTGSCPLASVVY